jgi:glutathione S-transferase
MTYELYGLRPSFYTRKVAAMLRSMGLPHEDRLKTQAEAPRVEAACGGYTKFPVLKTPANDWITDSTRIGLALDTAHPAVAIVPGEPALRAACLMLDDWADEWLLRAAIHWRVTDDANRTWVARQALASMMGKWQADDGIGAGHPGAVAASQFFLGAGAVNRVGPDFAEEVLGLLARAADVLTAHFAGTPFLIGTRVSLADFAIYGMLEAGLLWEPAARAYVLPRWPALEDYRLRVAAATAGEGEWFAAPTLAGVFAATGDFAAFLAANAKAVAAGDTIARWDGIEMRARRFTEKCRKATAAALRGVGGIAGAERLVAAYRS